MVTKGQLIYLGGNPRLRLIILVSTAIRLAVSPFTGHPYDLGIWLETGRYVAVGTSPYEPAIHLGYPPLWGFWCGVSYSLSTRLWPGSEFGYILLVKLPILLADLAITWMLVTLSRSLGNPASRSSAQTKAAAPANQMLVALFLLNPFLVVVGVIWGMMDNLVALLVIACAVAVIRKRDFLAGAFLGVAIALKLYPVLFVPATGILLIKSDDGKRHVAKFLSSLGAVALGLIAAPFPLLNWDGGQFYGVLVDQTSRKPGGISPIGILALLNDIGIKTVGPYDITALSAFLPLRLLWIPSVLLATLFAGRHVRSTSFESILDNFAFVYITWILTASWVSEQNIAILLILALAQAACYGFRKPQLIGYAFASCTVLSFAFFNVPATSFLFPIYDIDPRILRTEGKPFLPYLSMLFAAYAVAELARIARKMRNVDRQRVEAAGVRGPLLS